ncbi:response regulator [bacterium (Candidatus Howlettbacteria) CG_4_10_14_0_8_um_filter_40_9]|nr:MAG: response regulator [bacterium (Candidatus Howlettbacteria) CG_4_10_14_0_8_um_filter_40_9]
MEKDKIKILLAEDDLQLIDMYKKKFELEGFDVLLAEDGRKALEILKTETPDIALLDIMMPEVNGIEVLKEIRENPETKELLAVMLTNLSNESTAEEIYKYGATDYIVKSEMTPMQVADKVKELLKIYKK